ncbi:LCP family protein [Oribacterium sp. oral taxon 102]|uniref:LCP family protein n=1 Tax=Oribacterium sp. oral taxon 102 TaxID=671214 RepID=UPI0015BCEA00|nr:LCP family protein [Oribacterium sp. oral taxon 102]NWO20955.1 LCP family protein [Oribacterium sp. oral taxon 102]
MALDHNKGGRRPYSGMSESAGLPPQDTEKRYDRSAGGHAAQASAPEHAAKPRRVTAWNSEPSGTYSAFGSEQPRQASPDILRINSPQEGSAEVERERVRRTAKKKKSLRRILLIAVVELLTLVVIFCISFVVRYMNMTQDLGFDVQKVRNTNLDITKQQQMKGYWTVAVFGVDSRDGNLGKGALADVQIIVNIDMGSGEIKMASVYRDSYLNTGKRYAKINEAYSIGGPEGAVSALNRNLDLDIQNYATFNWKAVYDTVEMLGGVEADVTKGELKEINAYITETALEAGITKNPAAHYLKETGQQHLDGLQAVAYARLRHADTDFKRTERQRAIIQQLLDKAKKADLATLTSIINTVLPQISFNMDAGDILQLAKGVSRYTIVGSTGFPTDLKTQMMGKKGDCVIPTTLASNVTALHAFLFNDMNYNPSSAVWTYSQKIAEDSGNYKSSAEASAADKKAAADKESREAESAKKAAEEGGTESSKAHKESETDRFGNVIETTRKSGLPYETDADGNLIEGSRGAHETDRNGNLIDADGNIIRETTASGKNSTKESTAKETTKEAELTAADPANSQRESGRDRTPGTTEPETVAPRPGTSTTTTAAAPVSPGGSTAAAGANDGNGPGTIVE